MGGGRMGEIARQTLLECKNIELVDGEDFDILFSASYPSRISQELCLKAKIGAVNIHTSLLPEGRGSNPLNWALIWGKEKTGITIHKIVDSFDAGDICLQMPIQIFHKDNIVDLRERVESGFPALIKNFFIQPHHYIWNAKQQNQALASYAQKRLPEDSKLNLKAKPYEVYNLFRSCHPIEYPAFIIDEDGNKKIITNLEEVGNYEANK